MIETKQKAAAERAKPAYYTVMDIARMLGMSRQRAQQIAEREIGFVNVGTDRRRMIRVPRDDFAKWIERRRVRP